MLFLNRFQLFILLSCLTVITSVEAQNLRFHEISCKGTPPVELSVSVRSIDSTASQKENKNFEYDSRLSVSDLYKSGDVLFGDTLTKFIYDLGNRVLKANEIEEPIVFGVIQSKELNAYSISPNYVFLTTRLLTEMQFEEEILYVICHEIAHLLLNHGHLKYDLIYDIDEKKPISNLELLEMYYKYSRDFEFEADSFGFELFQRTNLNKKYAISALESLNEVSNFAKNFTYQIDYISDLGLNVSYNPEKKQTKENITSIPRPITTHPDIEDRIKKLHSFKSNNINSNGTINNIRKIARQQHILNCAKSGLAIETHYQTLLYEKEYGVATESEFHKYLSLLDIYLNVYSLDGDSKNRKNSVKTERDLMMTFFNSLDAEIWRKIALNANLKMLSTYQDPILISYLNLVIKSYEVKKSEVLLEVIREDLVKKEDYEILISHFNNTRWSVPSNFRIYSRTDINSTLKSKKVRRGRRRVIDTVLFYNPDIVYLTKLNGGYIVNRIIGEKLMTNYKYQISRHSNKLGLYLLPIQNFSDKNFNISDWNRFVYWQRWIDQKLNSQSIDAIPIVSKSLLEDNTTATNKYLYLNRIIVIDDFSSGKVKKIESNKFRFVKTRSDSEIKFVHLLIDTELNQPVFFEYEQIPRKFGLDLLRSQTYYSLNLLKYYTK